jgi:YesN/AraC family two-component response regulator
MFPSDESKAIKMFNEFVCKGPQSLEQINFDDVKDRQIIGSEIFVENVKTKIEQSSDVPEIHLNNNLSVQRKISLFEILKIVSKQTKVSADSISSQSRLREISEARRIFVFIAAKQAGYRLVEISKYLKQGDSSITRMIQKIENDLKYDLALSEKLGKISQVVKARPQILFVAEGDNRIEIGGFFGWEYSEKKSD